MIQECKTDGCRRTAEVGAKCKPCYQQWLKPAPPKSRATPGIPANPGMCQICRADITVNGVRDHNHAHDAHPSTSMCHLCFRGWLCGRCNTGLGMFADSPELLREAAKYLERYSPKWAERGMFQWADAA